MNPIKHVAIIMDGNGRWGLKHNKSRNYGHRAGLRTVEKIIRVSLRKKIPYLTLFAFSTENWKRTQTEVAGLMKLFKKYILSEAKRLVDAGVRVRFIGDRLRLEPRLVQLMDELEKMTSKNTLVNLTVAINYGGRDEVARASRRMAQDVAKGKLNPEKVNEQTLARYLDTYVLPDPDLVIRTSGEARISNFLLWQSAYAEYEFVKTLWPDFTVRDFQEIVSIFGSRKRRFGGLLAS